MKIPVIVSVAAAAVGLSLLTTAEDTRGPGEPGSSDPDSNHGTSGAHRPEWARRTTAESNEFYGPPETREGRSWRGLERPAH